MEYTSILLSVAFIAIAFGAITDLKKREVPDWLNFSLLFFGLSARALYSFLFNDYSIILYGIYGLILYALVAYAMFYAGQWGGGDAKMLIALGAVFGFKFEGLSQLGNNFALSFLFNIIIMGAVYGLIYIFYLAITKNWKSKFITTIKTKDFIKYRNISIIIAVSYFLTIIAFWSLFEEQAIITYSIFALLLLFPYVWAFVKAVEDASMYRHVKPSELVEGDWVAKPVKVGKKIVASAKDLGVSKEQIKELVKLYEAKKVKKILVKDGIPFVPAFLLGFIVTIFYGNILLLFVF